MALADIYPLAFLSGYLDYMTSFKMDIQRFDETHSSGDSRVWTSSLARPIWYAEIEMGPTDDELLARRINSRINALGNKRMFQWCDPTRKRPYAAAAPSTTITVTSISSDRSSITMSGFSSGYKLTVGDRGSSVYSSTKRWLFEVAEDYTANSSGVMSGVEVFPYAPINLAVGAAVSFGNPIMNAIIKPGTFEPYQPVSGIGRYDGCSFTILQKV